ncbi:ribokinase [Actinomadura sp. KC216]|uniref:ribokinase n=1 Tax=Actinomadura sp. KC216 TaxID=2530370 RepID=UPI001053A179|nr:ribokinase [Actinomadura sp. KC216]TDB83558.1 ribokinase [Actinomadura sp. KC216]
MTVHIVGAYILDSFMTCRALPRDGESVAVRAFADSDGGKGANQAITAARLEAPTRFVGTLGADSAGAHALTLLHQEGIDTTGTIRVPGTDTGRSFILVADDAQQIVATWPGAADALTRSDVDRALAGAGAGDVVSIQGEIPLTVSLHAARVVPERATVICNPSPVEQFRAHPDPWTDIDVLIVNDIEGHDLLGARGPALPTAQIPAALSSHLGIPAVVVTHGACGATLFDSDTSTHFAAPQVVTVDPTGAGDAFAGSFAARLSTGASLYHACLTAVTVASYSVTKRFCAPSYPTRRELESWERELAPHSGTRHRRPS